jgi:predicted permease
VRHTLSVVVFNFFLPALAFGLMVSAPTDWSLLFIPLTGAIVIMTSLLAGFAAYLLLPWFRDLPRPVVGIMIISAGFGNVMYLGLPVITGMLGAQYGYVAVLYDLLASTPILLTIGVLIAARYGSGKTVSFGASLKRVVLLPPLWGVVAGIAVRFSGAPVPQLVLDTAGLMGKAVIPVMIFTVGLALDFRDMKRLVMAVPTLVIKLALAPVLAWFIGSRLGMTAEVLKATMIEGAMPVMVLSLVIADEFDLDVPLAAACITVSTVALFFTMPLMMKVLF